MQILAHKMEAVNSTGAGIIATANPGCLLQLQAGVRLHGTGPARDARGGNPGRSLQESRGPGVSSRYSSRKFTSMVAATVTGLPSL